MRHKKLTESEQAFVEKVRKLEERLFPGQFDENDSTRMRNDGKYSWLYRPSHHIETGLLTEKDIDELRRPGRRLLSIGAHPVYLEQVLCELGVPAESIVVADNNPAIMESKSSMEKIMFDANGSWSEMGSFDLIIFPESLCISIRDHMKEEGGSADIKTKFPTDAREAELLAMMLKQALTRLRPNGEIRANGPMSHPTVVKAASTLLDQEGIHHAIDYQRYFLTVRRAEGKSVVMIG